MSYNPANYPIADSNILRGSLIVTFDNPNNDANAYYTVTVNSDLRNQEYYDSNNLFTTYLYVGDVVTVTIYGGEASEYLDLTRIDFTTDAVYGDNGINTVDITNVSGVDSVTFTATTVNTSYNFEYHLDMGTLIPVTPTPTPSITPTNTVTPSVTPTFIPSQTPTPSITATNTQTPSITPTNTVTPTVTPTITSTPGLSPTPTPSVTPSQTLVYVTWNYDESSLTFNAGYLYVYLNDILTYTLSQPGITFQGDYIPIGTKITNVLRSVDPSTIDRGGELKSYVNTVLDNFVYTEAGDPANTYITGATYYVTNGVALNFTGYVGPRTVPFTPTPTPTNTVTPTVTPTITPTTTPGLSQTPTVTPTKTTTPTPSVTPVPVTFYYRYVGLNGNSSIKTVSNRYISINSGGTTFNINYDDTWTTSINTGDIYMGQAFNPGGSLKFNRSICKTGISQTIDSRVFNIYINGTLTSTLRFDVNITCPTCPTISTTSSTSFPTYSAGDVILCEVVDTML